MRRSRSAAPSGCPRRCWQTSCCDPLAGQAARRRQAIETGTYPRRFALSLARKDVGLISEAAAAAAKTSTFLGERYRRIVKRRGKLKALVAIARSILVIIWHLLANPAARYRDLGAGYYTGRIDKDRKTRNHIRQLEAPGYTVTLAPAA